MSTQKVISTIKPSEVVAAMSEVTVKAVVPSGQQGVSGVVKQTTAPTDTSLIWVDTSGL